MFDDRSDEDPGVVAIGRQGRQLSMRVILQRVSSACVTVDERVTGEIGQGVLVLLGIHKSDTEADSAWLVQKIATLRIFADENEKMNRSLADLTAPAPSDLESAKPTVLVVSQFTLFASTRKGARPSFNDAAPTQAAIPLYQSFLAQLEGLLGRPVATGEFGAMMKVSLVNDGPVTILLDSKLKE